MRRCTLAFGASLVSFKAALKACRPLITWLATQSARASICLRTVSEVCVLTIPVGGYGYRYLGRKSYDGFTTSATIYGLEKSMQIRKAHPADQEPVFLLAQEFATSFDVERCLFRISFQHLSEDTHALLLVAEENSQIVGYCLGFDHFTFFANGKVAWVEEITVSAPMRNRGIGRLLMSAFEDWADGRGAKLVGLATRRAADFYEAMGYEESATYFRKLL